MFERTGELTGRNRERGAGIRGTNEAHSPGHLRPAVGSVTEIVSEAFLSGGAPPKALPYIRANVETPKPCASVAGWDRTGLRARSRSLNPSAGNQPAVMIGVNLFCGPGGAQGYLKV
jgi:hypothetical protein